MRAPCFMRRGYRTRTMVDGVSCCLPCSRRLTRRPSKAWSSVTSSARGLASSTPRTTWRPSSRCSSCPTPRRGVASTRRGGLGWRPTSALPASSTSSWKITCASCVATLTTAKTAKRRPTPPVRRRAHRSSSRFRATCSRASPPPRLHRCHLRPSSRLGCRPAGGARIEPTTDDIWMVAEHHSPGEAILQILPARRGGRVARIRAVEIRLQRRIRTQPCLAG